MSERKVEKRKTCGTCESWVSCGGEGECRCETPVTHPGKHTGVWPGTSGNTLACGGYSRREDAGERVTVEFASGKTLSFVIHELYAWGDGIKIVEDGDECTVLGRVCSPLLDRFDVTVTDGKPEGNGTDEVNETDEEDA